MPIYMKIEGVKGDVSAEGHTNWSELAAPTGLAADPAGTTRGYGDPEYKYVPIRRLNAADQAEDDLASSPGGGADATAMGGQGRDVLVGGAGGDAADTGLVKFGTGTLVLSNDGAGAADGDGDVDGQDFLIWQRGVAPGAAAGGGDLADWQSNYGTGGRSATGDDVVVDGRVITSEDPAAAQHELGHVLGLRHEHVGAATRDGGSGGDDILIGGRTGFDAAAGTGGVFVAAGDLDDAATGVSHGVTVLAWARVDGTAPDAGATGGMLVGMGDGSVRFVSDGVDLF